MARTDNDTWDLASSVGATATAVAAARARASRAESPLIDDPWAEPLVRAVGLDLFTRLAGGELDLAEVDGDGAMSLTRMVDNMATRTRYFDAFFTDATAAGVDQAVILASGLDARAYRLAWPAGTTVYEIDQPDVIEFKTTTLAGLGAQPAAEHRTVGVDLRDDWPAALRAAGFDPATPTAWSAEGLLGYLPPDAQDRLLDTITALSADGSRLLAEIFLASPDIEGIHRQANQRWYANGLDIDLDDLGFAGPRADPADYLAARGWAVDRAPLPRLLAEAGLIDTQPAGSIADNYYCTATRGAH